MQIQLNTDHNIEGHERLADHVRAVVESALERFSDQVTRVEVHLSDQNASNTGLDDKRCLMEFRIAGRQPDTVTHDASSVDLAITGAADKLKRSVEHTLERLSGHR